MKYILNKDLPTFKAGTEARISKRGNLLTRRDDDTEITMYSHSTLAKFPNILTEWFTPVEEKRRAVPGIGENFYSITRDGHATGCKNNLNTFDIDIINQGNWRWTREEAELEIKRRAAIERVRRYLVENDLLEEDKDKPYKIIYAFDSNRLVGSVYSLAYYSYYSPYGRIKNVDLNNQFMHDCKEDLLMIHS